MSNSPGQALIFTDTTTLRRGDYESRDGNKNQRGLNGVFMPFIFNGVSPFEVLRARDKPANGGRFIACYPVLQ